MKRTLLAALVLLVALSGSSCLIVDDTSGGPFDFNGVWSFALTNPYCQGQIGDITISQSGTNFLMVSSDLGWVGTCDPWAGTFSAQAAGAWGTWTFQGNATGPDSIGGGYLYVEYRTGQCSGTFSAQRIAYREADAPAGRAIERLP